MRTASMEAHIGGDSHKDIKNDVNEQQMHQREDLVVLTHIGVFCRWRNAMAHLRRGPRIRSSRHIRQNLGMYKATSPGHQTRRSSAQESLLRYEHQRANRSGTTPIFDHQRRGIRVDSRPTGASTHQQHISRDHNPADRSFRTSSHHPHLRPQRRPAHHIAQHNRGMGSMATSSLRSNGTIDRPPGNHRTDGRKGTKQGREQGDSGP